MHRYGDAVLVFDTNQLRWIEMMFLQWENGSALVQDKHGLLLVTPQLCRRIPEMMPYIKNNMDSQPQHVMYSSQGE